MSTTTKKQLGLGVALLIILGALWVLNLHFHGGQYAPFAGVKSEEVPVNMRFVVTDQYGQPAPRYRLGVKIEYVTWYHLLPAAAIGGRCYEVQTDDNGIARLHPWLKKGLRVTLEEIQPQDYIFPGNAEEAHNPLFKDRVGSSVRLRSLGLMEQVVPLHVLKHGKVIQPARYVPSTPSRQDGIQVEAKDGNVFTLDLPNNKIEEGEGDGTVVVRVQDAKRACALYRTQPYDNGGRNEVGEWSLSLEVKGKGGLIDAVGVVPLYAPEEGYANGLVYRFAIGPKPPPGAVMFGGSMERIQPFQARPTERIYYIFSSIGSLERTFYVRSDAPRFYGYLWFNIDLPGWGDTPEADKILIRTGGFYNPDGSTNLWRGYR